MNGHQLIELQKKLDSLGSSTFVACRHKGWEVRCGGINSPHVSHWAINYSQCETNDDNLVVWNSRHAIIVADHPEEFELPDPEALLAPAMEDVEFSKFVLTVSGPVFVPAFMIEGLYKRLAMFLPVRSRNGMVPVYYTTRMLDGWYWGTPVYRILPRIPEGEPTFVQGNLRGYKLGEEYFSQFTGMYQHSGSLYDHYWSEDRTPDVPYSVDGEVAVFSYLCQGSVIHATDHDDLVVEEEGLYMLVHPFVDDGQD